MERLKGLIDGIKRLFRFWGIPQDVEEFEIDIDVINKRLAQRIRCDLAQQQRIKDLEYRKSRSQSKNWDRWR